MMRRTFAVVTALALGLGAVASAQETPEPAVSQEEIDELKQEIKDLEKRVMKNERKTALDRIDFSGDFRFEANSLDMTFDPYFDGMQLQRLLVDTLFYLNATGMPPSSPEDVGNLIRDNYADYLYYLDNVVTFDWLKQTIGSFPPDQVQALLGALLPYTYSNGYDYSNSLLYTSRLRLQMDADISDNIDFQGRLSMYKAWGDSTGVQVFNGQPTSINVDGTTASVPNSDIVRVERAYFNWKNIGGAPIYLSIGRRPSTGGMPLNFRNDEPRGGSPIGTVVNYQFDGITFGWHITDASTFRLCYGVGYESGFGSAEVLRTPADRLSDASFFGVNWDILDTDRMFIQVSALRAFDVTDGFNGLVVLPVDPVTGQDVPPAVIRYTPSANLGDIDWASVVFLRHDGPFDWFASYSYMQTDPNNITTPFGGLMSDPFDSPEKQDGDMFYVGARFNFGNGKTKIGVEYNQGSEYWFNMAVAEDDIFAPKTAARGNVWEAYLTHRIASKFILKLDYMRYDYDYSGSGWHMGAPKELGTNPAPLLGFATPSSIDKFLLGLTARF
jgi:hypothetical protein